MLFSNIKKGLFLLSLFVLSACGGGGSSTKSSEESVIVNFDVITSSNTGGSILPSTASVQEGSIATFTITADDTFEVTDVSGCGGTLTNDTYTTGSVAQACEVLVTFSPIQTKKPVIVNFDVTTSSNTGGSILPSTASVQEGSIATFTITADDTFEVTDVSGCGGTLTNDTYTTGSVTQACEVLVTFSPIQTNDNIPPSASILFPGKISRANGSLVTIKGTAEDTGGVKAVRVNGELATTAFSITDSNDVRTLVNWEITVESSTDQEIIIETEDYFGNIDQQAEVINILNEVIPRPSSFTIDHLNSRLIGQLDSSTFSILDLITNQTSTFTVDTLNEWGPFSYQESSNRLIYSTIYNGQLQVVSVALETGQAQVILNLDLALETSLWSSARIESSDIAQDEDQLYLLLTYFSAVNNEDDKSIAFNLNLETNELSTVFDGKTVSGNTITTDFMAYSADGLVVFDETFSENNRVSLVELDGSDSEILSEDLGLTSTNINIDHVNSVAYTSGYGGFAKIDLTNGEHEVLSLDADAGDLSIAQIRSTGIDAQKNRLLVSDSSLDIIMAIDLATGARTNVISNGVGEGRVMIAPRELALDEVNNRAYVADDGGNAPSFILSIDLETGNRTKVVTFEHEFNYYFDGMSLDSEANLLYTVINNELISVNIDDGFTRIVSSRYIGLGALFSSLDGATLDTVNNRILTFAFAEEAILSIDTTTGDRSIIATSKSGMEVGTGASIANTSALALDEKNQVIYVASQFDKNIIKIDLATNERTVLLTSCNDVNLVDSGLSSLSYNETENSLLFRNDVAMKYKIDDNTCEMLTFDTSAYFLDLEENQKGQIYATGFNSLYQIDMETNQNVIISK